MTTMFNINKIIPLILIIATSCKKTEYEHEKSPYNNIKQFIIAGSTGDSTKCLISGDSIIIYWNPDVALPANITPSIVVDGKATISPASGATVPFNENTMYTVTAENGDVKTYRINVVLSMPIPAISRVSTPLTWLNSSQIYIYGEYFLANNDTSEIEAYMQRVSDGFEIPLELVRSRTTNYTLVANLPEFTAEQDTGLHKLFVKTGERVSPGIDVQLLTPSISYVTRESSFVQDGQDIHAGDWLTINYTATDSVARLPIITNQAV
jgi:hypothetical protein